jgi:hypothetical protein
MDTVSSQAKKFADALVDSQPNFDPPDRHPGRSRDSRGTRYGDFGRQAK